MKTHFPTVPVEAAIQRARIETGSPAPLVLVVDDEPLIVETLTVILNSHGLATLMALDGKEALELARLAPPDVLITDVAMIGMDGFELALEVSKVAPECDIILLTGEPSSCHQAAQYRAQGSDFVLLIKPVHPLDLLASVFELLSLRGWLVPDNIPAQDSNPADIVSLRPLSLRKHKAGIHEANDCGSNPANTGGRCSPAGHAHRDQFAKTAR